MLDLNQVLLTSQLRTLHQWVQLILKVELWEVPKQAKFLVQHDLQLYSLLFNTYKVYSKLSGKETFSIHPIAE